MKYISIESFDDYIDALWYIETQLDEIYLQFSDIKVELDLIGGKWRVGLITDTQQMELPIE